MAGVVIDLCVQGMVARGFVCRLDQVRRRYLSFGSHWLAGVVFRVPGWVCEEVVVAWVIRGVVEKHGGHFLGLGRQRWAGVDWGGWFHQRCGWWWGSPDVEV